MHAPHMRRVGRICSFKAKRVVEQRRAAPLRRPYAHNGEVVLRRGQQGLEERPSDAVSARICPNIDVPDATDSWITKIGIDAEAADADNLKTSPRRQQEFACLVEAVHISAPPFDHSIDVLIALGARLSGKRCKGRRVSFDRFQQDRHFSMTVDRQAVAADRIADDLAAHPRLDRGAALRFTVIAADDFRVSIGAGRQIAVRGPARAGRGAVRRTGAKRRRRQQRRSPECDRSRHAQGVTGRAPLIYRFVVMVPRRAFHRLPLSIAAALVAVLAPSRAAELRFGDDLHAEGWRNLTFRKHAATQYRAVAGDLAIVAERSSSMLYRPLAGARLSPRSARWEWRVDEGVRATDLTKKGGDDSALALYFIFADEKTARRLASRKASMPGMLGARSTTTLVYVYGGAAAGPFESPYVPGRNWSTVLQPATSARGIWVAESADLAADHARAFGKAPERLIAVGISSDSDDTQGRNVAFLRALSVE